ncbi:MAG TPA: MIP/aquaporin family protein [Candidatus Acidoferrales bacterium]|nr:MIP/aquaporin family protein [Candidatus Acidoferrales bacterium]
MYNSAQKLLAEFIGAFLFVFIGAGAICTDQAMRASGGSGIGLIGIALAHGLALSVVITAVGHISGAHFNPAVTIGFWVTRKMGTLLSLSYWVAQLLGSICAAYALAHLLPASIWGPVALGTPDLTDFTRLHGILLEGVMAFFLVFVVFATAVDPKGAFNKVAGFAIGLTVSADILLGGPFTGASMNPARSFGPAVIAHHWQNHVVYWVGPLFGGVIAAWVYDRFLLKKD